MFWFIISVVSTAYKSGLPNTPQILEKVLRFTAISIVGALAAVVVAVAWFFRAQQSSVIAANKQAIAQFTTQQHPYLNLSNPEPQPFWSTVTPGMHSHSSAAPQHTSWSQSNNMQQTSANMPSFTSRVTPEEYHHPNASQWHHSPWLQSNNIQQSPLPQPLFGSTTATHDQPGAPPHHAPAWAQSNIIRGPIYPSGSMAQTESYHHPSASLHHASTWPRSNSEQQSYWPQLFL